MIFLSHPISLGISLIFYSLVIGGLTIDLVFSWFLYLLVLVFLGGVIVLIIYMRTLSANEKFSPKRFNFMVYAPVLIRLIFFLSNSKRTPKITGGANFVSHVYESSNISRLVFLITYLFVTLVCVVKLVKFEEGPLIKRL